jgi:beta-galactosidase
MAITDEAGNGLLFSGNPVLEVSAHHNLLEDFESLESAFGHGPEVSSRAYNRHTVDVKTRDLTSVNIDLGQMGVGGDNSWGKWTHEQYRLTAKEYRYSFMMTPVKAGDNLVENARVVIE